MWYRRREEITVRHRPAFEQPEPASGLLQARRRLPIAWAQLGVIFAMLGIVLAQKQVDPDFWWHLRTGGLIFHSGIPTHDPFSWTAAGKEWVAHEWLGEAIIYGVEQALGYIGNVVLFSGATAAGLALMYALGRRLGCGTKPLVILTMLAAFVLISFIAVRPQVLTWVLFAVFVYALQRYEDGDPWPFWLLPGLMALWGNLHLGFTYGLMAVGVWLATRIYRRVRGQRIALRTPVLLFLACLVAVCLNPRGPLMLWYPVDYYLTGQTDPSLVMEWNRPDFTSPWMFPLLASIIFLGVSALSNRRAFLTCLSLVVIVLALQAVRNAPFVVFLMIPVTGSAVAARWRMATPAGDSAVKASPLLTAVVLGMIIAVGLIAGRAHGQVSGWKPSSRGYPAMGAAYLADQGAEIRLFNDYVWGGYLINELYPQVPVFIDGRADFYGGDLLDDYLTIAQVEPGWDDLLVEYGVNAAVILHDSRLARALRSDPAWQEAVSGSLESVFVLRQGLRSREEKPRGYSFSDPGHVGSEP